MAARVYIAWCKHEREFESLCEHEPQARVYISTFKFECFDANTLSSVCIRLYKHRASIFYFFYKIRLGNMLWRHNRVCIAWYKHGNWPITACVNLSKYKRLVYYIRCICTLCFHHHHSYYLCSCWLSSTNGALYMFAVPVCLVLFVSTH